MPTPMPSAKQRMKSRSRRTVVLPATVRVLTREALIPPPVVPGQSSRQALRVQACRVGCLTCEGVCISPSKGRCCPAVGTPVERHVGQRSSSVTFPGFGQAEPPLALEVRGGVSWLANVLLSEATTCDSDLLGQRGDKPEERRTAPGAEATFLIVAPRWSRPVAAPASPGRCAGLPRWRRTRCRQQRPP